MEHNLNIKYVAPNRMGYTSVEHLHFLKGEPFDDRALDFIHALRPSLIRVIKDFENSDACCWRVTVYVDYLGNIRKITQEVEVGLRTAKNGHELSNTRS